jgi:ligand-binding sensor domain-containing protein
VLPEGDQIWAGGRDGFVRVDRVTGKRLAPLGGEPRFGYVHALWKSAAGAMWVAHDDGVAVYDKGKWTAYGEKDGLPFRRAFSLAEDGEGRILAGIDGGIAAWQGGRWTVEMLGGAGTLGEVDVLYRDRAGRLWAGSSSPTRGGLRMREGGSWKTFDPAAGLPHPSVNAVIEDRAGTIWVGTGFASSGAAARLMPGTDRLTPFALGRGWDGVKVRSLYEDTTGRIWLGLEYDGALVFENATWKRIAPGKGLAGQEVKVVRQDAAGVFWLGTSGGLSRFDGSSTSFEDVKPVTP